MANPPFNMKEWWDGKLEGDLPKADPVEWMVASPGKFSDRVDAGRNSELAACRFSFTPYAQLDAIYADRILGTGEHTQ